MTDRQQSDTLGSFLAWRQSRLATATTEDVIEAASRLIAISGAERVSHAHVDQLIEHYRRRFAGPRAIVMAQAVADDFCVFQDSQLPDDPQSLPAPRIRGALIEDEDSLPIPPADMPVARRASIDLDTSGDAIGGGIELDLDGEDVRGSGFRERFHMPGLASSVPPEAPPMAATSSHPPPPRVEEPVPPAPALPNIGTPSDRPPPDRSPSDRPPSDRPPAVSTAPISAAPPAHAGPDATGRSITLTRRHTRSAWWETLLEDAPPHSGKIAAAVLAIIVVGVVYKSGCLRDTEPVEVRGAFAAEHLGVRIQFPDAWMYAPDYDQREDIDGGWEARWSVFYRGQSPTSYESRLTVKVFTKEDGTPASEEDARTVGASDTLSAVIGRDCFQEDYTFCRAIHQRVDQQRVGAYEYFFTIGGKVIMVRALMPLDAQRTPSAGAPLDVLHIPANEDEATAIAESVVPLTR